MERVGDIDLLDALATGAADLAACVAAADVTVGVPTCPGWTLADLALHTGSVHRWATEVVTTGRSARMQQHDHARRPDALAAWLLDGAHRLGEALAASEPDAACWTFGFPPEQAWFWRRRQALETELHRCDARAAVGEAAGVDGALGRVGVDEVVDFQYRRQVTLGRTEALEQAVRLRATEVDDTWLIGGSTPSAEAAATIEGPADVLFLLLWRRTTLADPRLRATGDGGTLTAFADARLTP
jgi:uncharacterized protein (TIGR03083 family)